MMDDDESFSEESENISANYDYELTVEELKSPRSTASPPLTTFCKIVVRCILNECMDQLYILRNINTQDNANFVPMSLNYVSIAERYMGVEKHVDYRINSSINNYEKLARDIHRIIQILTECLDDVQINSSFSSLKKAVDAMKRMREDEKTLFEERDANDKHIIELRRQCEDEYQKNIHIIEETNTRIQQLRFEVEDLNVYKNYELDYFEDWERTRKEQNEMSCEKSEQYYQKIINDAMNKINSENRCHSEFERYIEESKNDYLDEIQFWMKRYDEETERHETEMITLKANMEKLTEDHIELKQKYEARKAEIEDWLSYKRKKKEKEDLEALQLWAATKIQAWWRGVMFRKKLGPYRKKKGKDKDKKGKKKK